MNSLRLLDSYKNFVTTRDDDDDPEAEQERGRSAAAVPASGAAHAFIATYEKKYQMKLPGPVQVEVYPDHEDFAVRTMGMPGLGALGVTFGQVVAMDSPSARKPGDFNWGATLWHEMSHVFILTATNLRVPRWFTEGLAVHEEGERSPEWSEPADAGSAGRDPRQEAAAGGRAGSRLCLSRLSGAGDRLVFSGRQHLRLRRRANGAKTSCSTWSTPTRS